MKPLPDAKACCASENLVAAEESRLSGGGYSVTVSSMMKQLSGGTGWTARVKYKVIISDEAAQMLVSHSRFLAQVSEKAALDLIAEFSEKAKSLEEFPERNPWLSDPYIPAGKYRKLLMGKRYLLIYQIKGDTVYVDYVVDCRQDYGWLL